MQLFRYKLKLSYKGTHYFGWQVQPNQLSIQETIENCLTKLNGNNKVDIVGCGRTDTGVHATDYTAHFDLPQPVDTNQWLFKLNTMLPQDIAIIDFQQANDNFHARFDAKSRTYEYRIHTIKNPFVAETSWYYKVDLDLDLINKAAEIIKANKDFECFSKVKTDVTNFNCDIHEITFTKQNDNYIFKISANRFLRNMVRAMVGTLIEIGTLKMSLEELQEVLNSKNRSNAGVSVPAHGLTLTNVIY